MQNNKPEKSNKLTSLPATLQKFKQNFLSGTGFIVLNLKYFQLLYLSAEGFQSIDELVFDNSIIIKLSVKNIINELK